MQLYNYQEFGVNWLINNGSPKPKHSLLGDDMGLGKTAQMIVAAERLGAKRILVMCPATIKINWMREFLKWSGYRKIFIVTTGKDRPPSDSEVVIVNYDLVIRPFIKKELKKFNYTVGIMDEVHYLQSLSSQRTKAILAKDGVIWNCEYKWGSTGTFMPNRPKNMYPLIRSIAPYVIEPYLDYWPFAYRYCGAYMGDYGIDDNGCSNAIELGDRLKPFMLRRLKEEVLAELPEKTIQYIYLEQTPKIKAALEYEYSLSEEEINEIYEFKALGNMAKIRHELALAKIDQCVKHIKDQLLTLNKIGVGFYHKDVLVALKDALSDYGVCIVTGGMTGNQKQEQIDDFVNNPNKRIFLGQIQAAGVGIDGLQLVCSDVFMVETSWVPGDIDQFIDRWRRIGQKNNVHVQIFVVPDSLEENIIYSELEKRKNIRSVMSRVETLVNSKDKVKEKNKMSLEKNIERMADALETIAANFTMAQTAQAAPNTSFVQHVHTVETANNTAPTVDQDHEKERLVAEAKALGLPGKPGAMSVENLKKRIAEHKAAAAAQAPVQNFAPETAINNVQQAIQTPQVGMAHQWEQQTPPQQFTQQAPQQSDAAAPAPTTSVVNDAMVQKAAQDLVKKLTPQPATQFVQGVIYQIGGDVIDGVTGANRPARLTDLNAEQKAVVLDFINAKLAEA